MGLADPGHDVVRGTRPSCHWPSRPHHPGCSRPPTWACSARPPTPRPTGQTVLVWGGSTSVGSNAIQLAIAAGYEVITTASPRNFDYVRSPWVATLVFDYNSPTVVPDIVAAFDGRTLAGAIAFGTTGADSCVGIAGKLKGNKFVSVASTPVSFASLADDNRGRFERVRVMLRLIGANVALQAGSPKPRSSCEVHLWDVAEEQRGQYRDLPRLPAGRTCRRPLPGGTEAHRRRAERRRFSAGYGHPTQGWSPRRRSSSPSCDPGVRLVIGTNIICSLPRRETDGKNKKETRAPCVHGQSDPLDRCGRGRGIPGRFELLHCWAGLVIATLEQRVFG